MKEENCLKWNAPLFSRKIIPDKPVLFRDIEKYII